MGNCKSTGKKGHNLHRCNSEDNVDVSDSGYYNVKTPPRACTSTYDAIIKCVFIGPSGTGKTLVLTTLSNGDVTNFNSMPTVPTIGVDFGNTMIQHMNRNIKLQCWDTAGEARFATIATSYMRATQFVLLFCDMRKPQETLSWLTNNQILSNISYDTKVFLVCNTHLMSGHDNDINQLQATITDTYPNLSLVDSLVFDFCKRDEILSNLSTVLNSILLNDNGQRVEFLIPRQIVCKKPAIYIYDSDSRQNRDDGTNQQKEYNTKVGIQLHGKMNVEIPVRDINDTWSCSVVDSGLIIQDQVYPYIYWEADWPIETLSPNIVNKQKLQQFDMTGSDYGKFSELLSTVLSQRELADFDAYWQPLIKQDKQYRVTIIKPKYFDTVFPLSITVSDDKSYQIMRLEFVFEQFQHYSVNTPSNHTMPQQLNIVRPAVSNYDEQVLIIEWGGTLIE